jgi:Kef-type K+ transport system membrane component KefB
MPAFEIHSPALAMGVLLLAGYLGGRLARRFRLPAVAGYVLAGVLMGPSVFKIIPDTTNAALSPLKDFGVGMVAMVIGSELVWKKMRHLGWSIFVISICEAAATFILVYLAIRYLLGQPLVVSAMLASLATVTTPVATFAVIREYRAKGPFTSTLLGAIAVDDIWCITAVGMSVGLVLGMGTGTNALQIAYLLPPLWEVLSSIGLGIVIGIASIFVLHLIHDELEILALIAAIVFLNAGIARVFDLSALLMTMTSGVIISNFYRDNVLKVINRIDLPILIAFFTLAGAGLHLDVLVANWSIAAIYIVFRILGKTGGCYVGARISGADEKVRRYLGPAMLTKAGLSLGLLIYMQERLKGVEVGALLVSVELAAITFFEITGPIVVRWALFKVGEARHPESHPKEIQ